MPSNLPTCWIAGVSTGADPLRAGPDLTRYLLVCGGLIAAILLLAWMFRRLVANSGARAPDRRGMRIVDMLPLGGKQRVAVVRCYDRTFVLGLGDKEVHLVGELDRELAPQEAPRLAAKADFSRLLGTLMGRPQAATASAGADRAQAAPSNDGASS